MTRFWRHKIPHRPNLYWHVMGRKMFDTKYSLAVRAMWGCGNYPIS